MKPKLLKSDKDEQAPVQPNKNKIQVFLQQFNTLDTSSYGTWPLTVKVSCYVFSFMIVCLVCFFVAIQPQRQAIESAQAQQQVLLNEYKEKSSKLRNMKQYQASLLQMEKQFNQQLEQLPKETEIPSLIEDIHRAALQSGLKITNLQLEGEQVKDFFIEQPISIEARGGYHAYGQFISHLAELPRIVTVHDFVMTAVENPDQKSDIPIVDFTLKAKTYRYINRSDQAHKSAAKTPQASTPPAAEQAAVQTQAFIYQAKPLKMSSITQSNDQYDQTSMGA